MLQLHKTVQVVALCDPPKAQRWEYNILNGCVVCTQPIATSDKLLSAVILELWCDK
jgi:hypothetical protein